MNEPTFDIKIIHPYRLVVLASMFIMGGLWGSLQIDQHISDTLSSAYLIILFNVILVRAYARLIYGRVTITAKNEEFHLEWKKKLPFNFKSPKSIAFSSINKIRIDANQGNQPNPTKAVKIYFNPKSASDQQKSLFLHTFDNYYFRGDINEFIGYLSSFTKQNSIKITSHWQEWEEKGYRKLILQFLKFSAMVLATLLLYLIFRK